MAKINKGVAKILVLCLVFLISTNFFAQEALKSTEEEYYDYLSLKGFVERPTLGYRTLSDSEWNINVVDDEEPIWSKNNLGTNNTLFAPSNVHSNWFLNGINQSINMKIYGLEWFNSYNTSVPYGQNDGALWQGRGYNTSLTTGIRFEGYGFELTLKPQLSFSQNKPFDYMKSVHESEYGYFVGGIDLVQRYGDKPFWNFDWGDSEVRWSLYNFTIGFGTQTPWLGPAWLNPMLGSNNAASYPKFDIGLRRTQVTIPFTDIYIGDIEGRIFVGQLSESDYFDSDSSNNNRMATGLTVSYAPSFIPGFTLGVNRIFLTNWDLKNLSYVGRLFTLSRANELEDQKASIFIDWFFPIVGFEVYGEMGIDDFSIDPLSNLFHTAIYTLGFKKNIPFKNKNFDAEFFLEFNNFEMSQDFQLQWTYGGYYFHGLIKQGYTNKGQILGAGSGAMGNSQYFGFKLYYPKGSSSFYIHRYNQDNNYIYNQAVDKDASTDSGNEIYNKYYASNDTYFTLGLTSNYFMTANFFLNAKLAFVWNHFPLYNTRGDDRYNFNFELQLKYFF